jgi:hypothetical protein
MTLEEVNVLLAHTDCFDTAAVELALNARARAIAEFAASAPRGLLAETHAAGQAFRDRLEMAQIERRRALDRMTNLSRGLQANLEEHRARCVTCFG